MANPVWDVTVLTKYRDRMLGGDITREFFREVVIHAREAQLFFLPSNFTVNATLIEARTTQEELKRVVPSAPSPTSQDRHT